MHRILLFASIVLLPFVASAQSDQQELVDRSTLTIQDLVGAGDRNASDVASMLRRARAVMVCPRVFKAGFILGGEGGSCVLVARDGSGSWSAPAFYGMGTGSVGLQIGIQDAELMMMILTDKGLNAVLDSQFKIGGDASIAVTVVGAGIQGATTAAVGADIVAYAHTRGLFGGISLAGSLMSSRSEWDQAYYGKPLGARQIVVEMAANNAGADPLRAVLTKYGTPGS
jgi:lipid-binding SYLF domain-containing protein